VHELTDPRFRLERVSTTFHARDVFAPAAAHLAAGVPIAELGPGLDPATLVRLSIPAPEVRGSQVRATVIAVDRFGNVQLNLRREHLGEFTLPVGERIEVAVAFDAYFALVCRTFADAGDGELIVYEDSYGAYAVAITGGDAAALIGVRPGDELRLLHA
jgi:S-adenosylmethionine hydrolase